MSDQLTDLERDVVMRLADAWNAYLQLPRACPVRQTDDDTTDFRKAIHDAQRIVLARPAARTINKKG